MVSSSSINGGAGNDTLIFSGLATNASIGGGLGNDSVLFAANQTGAGLVDTVATNQGATYFFGTNSGSDTLSFGGSSGTSYTNGTIVPLTIGYDSVGLGAHSPLQMW